MKHQNTPSTIKVVLFIFLFTILSCHTRIPHKNRIWINSNNNYHTVVREGEDKKEAINQLILKILELSEKQESWNSLVLDNWTDRLIGNIQNYNEAVGVDRGFRVALHFDDYEQSLFSEDNEMKYYLLSEKYDKELEELILDVLNDQKFKNHLLKNYDLSQFVFEITQMGERKNIKIPLKYPPPELCSC